MRTPRTWLVLATVLFFCTGAAFAEFRSCGKCTDISQESCEEWELGYPCHKWEGNPQTHDRGTDSHMYGGDFYLGTEDCEETHQGCGGGGGGELAAIELPTAIQKGDQSVLGDMARLGLWLEVNEVRSAVQILGYCSVTASEDVVAHIPVSQNMLGFWSDVTS